MRYGAEMLDKLVKVSEPINFDSIIICAIILLYVILGYCHRESTLGLGSIYSTHPDTRLLLKSFCPSVCGVLGKSITIIFYEYAGNS